MIFDPRSPVEAARLSPLGLIRYVKGATYRAAPLHALINRMLMKAASASLQPLREMPRHFVLAVPPRHGKSLLASIALPAWYLGRWPDKTVAVVGYGETFVSSFGKQARNALEIIGPDLFGVTVDPRSSAANRWSTADANDPRNLFGGGMWSLSIDGPAMGLGFNVMCIDDPIKNKDDLTPEARQAHWEWFNSVAKPRIAPGGSIVLIQQRWHEDDLPGRLMREEGLYEDGGLWVPVILPERAEPITNMHIPGLEETMADPLDRAEGEHLWPGFRTNAEWQSLEAHLDPEVWASQYQQRPALIKGATFAAKSFVRYDVRGNNFRLINRDGSTEMVPIDKIRIVHCIDLATSLKTRADYSVIGVFGVTQSKKVIVLRIVRRKVSGVAQERLVETEFGIDRPSEVWIENVGYQLDFITRMKAKNLPVKEFKPRGDKLSRARTAAVRIDNQQVFFPYSASWLKDFEAELIMVPQSTHDDQADVLAMICAVTAPGQDLGNAIRILAA